MKSNNIVLLFVWGAFFAANDNACAQSDATATLEWVKRQSIRLDSMLEHARVGGDHLNMVLKLSQAYPVFDAVATTALYCPEIRDAAQQGRNEADIINFRLEKDLNSIIIRVSLARQFAIRMKHAADLCGRSDTGALFIAPMEAVYAAAADAMLELSDGQAVQDMHILAQKLEHTIRILFEIEHLASTMEMCSHISGMAREAIANCERAVSAQNTKETTAAVNAALQGIRRIKEAAPCR